MRLPCRALLVADSAVTSSPAASTTATFTVTLSAASSQPVTVQYVTADGTARAGVDYAALAPSTLTFAAGQTQQSVTVAVDPEPAGTGTRTFSISLFNASGATIASASATGTINAPSAPVVSIQGATVLASAGGPSQAAFVVTLSAPAASVVTVNYATADGTARAGVDYSAGSGMLTFAAGQTERETIQVGVNATPLRRLPELHGHPREALSGRSSPPARPPARSSIRTSRPRSRSAIRR